MDLFWGFYGHRLHLYRDTEPHKGFQILRSWCTSKKYHVVTSNVDGHFQKSGFPEDKVFEIHGSINHMQCTCCRKIYSADGYNVKYNKETFEAEDPLPKCKNCVNVILRPNILMFSDYSFMSDRVDEQERTFNFMTFQIKKEDSVVIIELGAGLAIPSIRNIGESLLYSHKKTTLVRINPEDFQKPHGWDESSPPQNKAFFPLKEGSLQALNSINQFM